MHNFYIWLCKNFPGHEFSYLKDENIKCKDLNIYIEKYYYPSVGYLGHINNNYFDCPRLGDVKNLVLEEFKINEK